MFFDVHAHVYKYQYPAENGEMLFISLGDLVKKHDEIGIERAILLPLVSPEVYVPQSVGEIIEIARNSNGRFVPYCNIDPRVYTNSSDAPIGRLLEYYRQSGCMGIGEVLPNLGWLDARMQNLLHHVQEAKFPLIFDMTGRSNHGYGIYDDPGMPQLEACLEKFPDLLFVGHGPAFWAEISVLRNPEDRFGYPSYPVEKQGRVPQLMRQYPNLTAELSAGSGANALTRDLGHAADFLNEFQDKLMFGTDICAKNNSYPTARLLQDFKASGEISSGAFEKIAQKNAARLLGV
ncbi:MAG: amidohydrolase [Oscillospiraceae bacterium]|nr:amidohydrolase [Oscillospiraceae bacterium]